MRYPEFVKEAVQCYQSLPTETNELYKKYSVNIDLPERLGTGCAAGGADLERTIREIGEKTRIRFDVIITSSFARSTSKSVRIAPAEEADPALLDGKLFKSGEDRLAAYINAHARHFVVIEAWKRMKSVINILFVNDGDLSVQVFLKAAEGAGLEVSEVYLSGTDRKATVSVLHEISGGNSSSIELNALHDEAAATSVVSLCKGSAGAGARLHLNMAYCGGGATKARSVLDARGDAGRIGVSEFAYGMASQQFDIDTSIINSTPYSSVSLDSGVILDDASRCMLKGFAKVADKTKGSVSTIVEKGILLSKDAHMDALPDLSIDYSNEVKASHSASTAPIDQDALFYLTSRGIEEGQARRLFVAAFISRYLSKIGAPAAREVAMSVMLDKLEKRSFGALSEVTPRNVWMVKPAR